MSWPYPTRLLTEGATRLRVPATANPRGPASSRAAPVFYNDAMAFSRDLNVLVVRALRRLGELPAGPYLDGLTASGARGLRLAQEADLEPVVLNDANPQAVALAAHNVELNGLEGRVSVSQRRLQVLLAERSFAMVDLDPFGSPVPFLENALQALQGSGLLALSATDLPPLCGAQPRVCRRRYQALPLRGPAASEFGVRLLLGWVVRRAAAHDLGVRPQLCFAEGHHLRLYLKLRRGAGRAEASLELVREVCRDPEGDYKEVGEERPAHSREAPCGGPFWIGPLSDRELLTAMVRELPEDLEVPLAHPRAAGRWLGIWHEESGLEPAPLGFFTLDELGRSARCGPPRLELMLETLRAEGHGGTRTNYAPTGLRTTAGYPVCMELVRELARRRDDQKGSKAIFNSRS